jgi:hypothetical protein
MKKTKESQMQPGDQEVNWQPLSRLLLIAQLIDNGVVDAEKQYQLVAERLKVKQVFHDSWIAHIKRVHGEQLEFVAFYCEQIERWKKEILTREQLFELMRLTMQCERLKDLNTEILAVASAQEKT